MSTTPWEIEKEGEEEKGRCGDGRKEDKMRAGERAKRRK